MKNRPQVFALGVAVLAIGGMLWFSNRRQHSYRFVGITQGPIESYPSIVVEIVTPDPTTPEQLAIGREYRFLNQGKPILAEPFTAPSEKVKDGFNQSFRLPLGYPDSIDQPKLEVYENRKLQETIDLPPFPKPVRRSLNSKPSPLFRLILNRDASPKTTGYLTFQSQMPLDMLQLVPKVSIPEGEAWEPTLLATDFLSGLHLQGLGTVTPHVAAFQLPYGANAEEASIEIRRIHQEEKIEEIRIPGLRLVPGPDGQTVLQAKEGQTFRTAGGVIATVQAPPKTPLLGTQGPDEKRVTLFLNASYPVKHNGFTGVVSMEIVSPHPEELGLRRLRINGGGPSLEKEPSRMTRQVVRSPFAAVVRFRYPRITELGIVRASVPVEQNAPSALEVKPKP